MRLHIGCGKVRLMGYLNIDLYDGDEHIDCSNILESKKEWEGKVEEIVGYHVFEHFPYKDAKRAMKQYYQLLKDGGKLVLEMPDMELIAQMYLDNPDELTCMYMWGNQSEPGQFHYWGWDKRTLLKLAKDCGFRDVYFPDPIDYHKNERPCLRLEATK